LKFRKKSEHQLSPLSDDDLVAYLVAARDVGQHGDVRLAAGMLVWRRYDVLLALVRLKVDDDRDVEDIVQQIVEDTMKAAFKGEHTGEFFSLMKTIQKRRVADFYDRKSRTPNQVGPNGDGTSPLDGLAGDDDPIAGSIAEAALNQVLDGYSERNRTVITMKIDGYPAREIAELIGNGMSAANVDQIFSRFRREFDAAWDPRGQNDPEQGT
jgi:RNA polymerase sigma factor (sigma-70 family)